MNPTVISFVQLKNSNKAKWHQSSCTSSHKQSNGTWSRSGDTITIYTKEFTSKFILVNKSLCLLEENGAIIPIEHGLRKTLTKTWLGISLKSRIVIARRRRS